MKYGIKTLDDFDFKDKTVLARLDLNSPYDYIYYLTHRYIIPGL